ncbi:thiamine diphosphokinase [Adlercreutzia murintestinalis]|uniref:thiamine diphosphokinase n=1 Tax=Adlercreutzia murintestinalis TaxID=2941325 RepID=UPI002041624E|nr:thiamine diphosphokinase [Adlercreutzia murintestinalis]
MKTCALVGASEFNADYFQFMDDNGLFDYVMAVDGGFAHLEAIGRAADAAIGDFDSLGYVPRGLRVIRKSPHKDESDMELAMMRVKAQRFDTFYVFGALGGRMDHTLANMQLCAQYAEKGINVVVIDASAQLTFLVGPDSLEVPACESGTLSIFAMNDACTGVFERGLEWELEDYTLTNRTTLGLSNEFKGDAVMVGVEEGTLAVFLPLW